MTQKRIGIDARLMYQTGVGVYIRNLIYNLASLNTPGMVFYIYARQEDIAAFRLRDTKLYRIAKFKFISCNIGWHSFSEQILFLFQLWRDKLDLMHFTYFSWPILYRRPFVATIHDTILLTHATGNATTKWYVWYRIKHAAFRLALSEQVRRAKSIIVPSHVVKKELGQTYPRIGKKIHVIFEGVDAELLAATAQPVYELENRRFFLYVGNCYPHKNVETLIQAFEMLAEKDMHLKLCLVGPDNQFSQQIKKRIHAKASILFLQNISASELKWLYSSAKALVFPSLAEGFGLPIVEALSCGCPLILSDISVFREVAGDCAQYFDPHDPEMLSNRMNECLSRSNSSCEPTSTHSFRKMVESTISIYKEFS